MTKAFLIDVALCNGCYNCQIVCKDEHVENDWRPYTAPQPLTGHFWMHMTERERGQVPWVRVAYKPVLCAHCDECPLLELAPDAVYRRDDGFVVIDPAKATGRRDLVDACPLGAVYWNDELELPQKCTGCAHLLDSEDWNGLPRCVDACPTGALRFGELEDFADELADAQPADEVAGLGPHVFYKHLPKRFVAGSAVDLAADEVVIGAKVELLLDGEPVATLETDELGDFKFNDVEPAAYVVRISAEGYEPYEVEADLTDIDLSVGDLFLTAARPV